MKEDLISICTYILETEESDYNESAKQDTHIYALAKNVLKELNNYF